MSHAHYTYMQVTLDIVSVSYMENSAYSGKYTFFVFLTCDQKNVKSHVFWIFIKKTKKRFLELWGGRLWLNRQTGPMSSGVTRNSGTHANNLSQ